MQKWIILVVVCVILILGTVIILNVDIETEYVPETEIEEVELRKTIVTLYFNNNETTQPPKETRLIDSKVLLKNPYEELVKMILDGPENNNYGKVIPEGTNLLETSFENGCVTINFSKEFIDSNADNIQKSNSIYSLVNTLTELTEVNSIKILIEGQETDAFSDCDIDLKNQISRR